MEGYSYLPSGVSLLILVAGPISRVHSPSSLGYLGHRVPSWTNLMPSRRHLVDVSAYMLGISPLASKWAVLGELGWFLFRSAVLLGRILFLGRLFRREEVSLLAKLLDLRLSLPTGRPKRAPLLLGLPAVLGERR